MYKYIVVSRWMWSRYLDVPIYEYFIGREPLMGSKGSKLGLLNGYHVGPSLGGNFHKDRNR
jgi:hypothetical protein